jgi:hypothetical protein
MDNQLDCRTTHMYTNYEVIQMTSKQQFCCLEIGKSCIYAIHAHFPPHLFPIMMQYRAGQYLVGVQVFGSVLKKKILELIYICRSLLLFTCHACAYMEIYHYFFAYITVLFT